MVPDLQDSFQASTTFHELLRFVQRWLVLALLIGLAVAALTYLGLVAPAPSYSAEASLLLAAPQAGLESIGLVTPPMVDPTVYRTAILEGGILQQVLQQLGEADSASAERDLAERIRITIDSQLISSIIRIRVTSPDAALAARSANLISAEVLQWDTDRGRQVLLTGVTALQASLAALDNQLAVAKAAEQAALLSRREQFSADLLAAQDRADSLTVAPLLKTLNQAAVPVQPDPTRAGLLAVFAGLLAAGAVLGAAWLVALLRNRVDQTRTAERATGLPVLTVFPAPARHNAGVRRDAADILRNRLTAGTAPVEPIVIVVTSPVAVTEKSGLAVALAESFGRAGQQTLLLDGNLRAPTTGDEFRLIEGEFVSLEQFLTDPARRLEFVSVRLGGRPVFSLIPSFTPAGWPADLLPLLPQLLQQWQQRFPVIIIDTAPLLPFPDTPVILGSADIVILAGRLGLTTPQELRQATQTLLELHGKLPGLVIGDRIGPLARFQHLSHAADDYAISILRAPRAAPQLDAAEDALHTHGAARSA